MSDVFGLRFAHSTSAEFHNVKSTTQMCVNLDQPSHFYVC